MSAIDDLLIEIEKHAVMRAHASLLAKVRAELAAKDAAIESARVVLTELQFAKADDTHDMKWAAIAYAKRELADALERVP